jgi:hypothetical protein
MTNAVSQATGPDRQIGRNSLIGEDVAEFLHEQMGFVQLYAGMAQRYIEAGDGPGLNYSVRFTIARIKAVAGTLNDLAEQEVA